MKNLGKKWHFLVSLDRTLAMRNVTDGLVRVIEEASHQRNQGHLIQSAASPKCAFPDGQGPPAQPQKIGLGAKIATDVPDDLCPPEIRV